MPFQVGTAPSERPLRVSASAPAELLWVLMYLNHEQSVPDAPALKPIKDRSEALSKRVRAFWKGPKIDYTEILVLAERGGTLENADAEPFLKSIPKVAALPVEALALPSETPEERTAIHDRLKRLAGSSDLRRGYSDLLQTVWGLVKPGWIRDGLPLVERTVAAWQRDTAAGREIEQILFSGHIYFHFIAKMNALDRRPPIVLTPSFFASRGGHVVALPRLLHVGAGIGPEDLSEALRRRAEGLARQLKVLADPTRLAILFHLVENAYTVSEMAARFQVSQPTVSGHIKALRDEGLVEARRNGQRMPYAANRQRITTLLRDTERALMVSGHQP